MPEQPFQHTSPQAPVDLPTGQDPYGLTLDDLTERDWHRLDRSLKIKEPKKPIQEVMNPWDIPQTPDSSTSDTSFEQMLRNINSGESSSSSTIPQGVFSKKEDLFPESPAVEASSQESLEVSPTVENLLANEAKELEQAYESLSIAEGNTASALRAVELAKSQIADIRLKYNDQLAEIYAKKHSNR